MHKSYSNAQKDSRSLAFKKIRSSAPFSKKKTAVDSMVCSLAEKQFFKLVLGGSFTDTNRIAHLVTAYAKAGIDCIDMAADVAVIDVVSETLTQNKQNTRSLLKKARPVLMISLPLDPDPHFRKITLNRDNCIDCGICIPECPSGAMAIPKTTLEISQSLCFGCSRCVPACPVDALKVLPFRVEKTMHAALSHGSVGAVEIHSHYCDAAMLSEFLEKYSDSLKKRLLSLCFRPKALTAKQITDFFQVAQNFSPHPVVIQADGDSMSGQLGEDKSIPALNAADTIKKAFLQLNLPVPYITISGGISEKTALHLQNDRHQYIAGVAVGTVARQWVYASDSLKAYQQAKTLVNHFH
ncbi:MAG: 4Fe-4S dicluster domain-containing protein [Cyanobacteria bacterium P01_H01_bin.74]